MKTILAYLRTNKMLGNPKNVPEGLSPMFYIGLDRDFEIDIRAKINKEIEDIQSLERQLEEARYSATDYAMKLGRANEKLAEAREEALKYKIKYNNQSSDMLRLRQSKKDQTELIRKLKEKGDE